ncbi:hypothetical protein JCM9957A_49770 [Kineosporia succinea]
MMRPIDWWRDELRETERRGIASGGGLDDGEFPDERWPLVVQARRWHQATVEMRVTAVERSREQRIGRSLQNDPSHDFIRWVDREASVEFWAFPLAGDR